jgi:hypothetical protein
MKVGLSAVAAAVCNPSCGRTSLQPSITRRTSLKLRAPQRKQAAAEALAQVLPALTVVKATNAGSD